MHEVRQFIGLASFFRKFVKNFAIIARSLTDLLKTKFGWNWTDEQANAFHILKEKLVERPVIALYDAKFETELHTNASKLGIAVFLCNEISKERFDPSRIIVEKRRTTNKNYTHSI